MIHRMLIEVAAVLATLPMIMNAVLTFFSQKVRKSLENVSLVIDYFLSSDISNIFVTLQLRTAKVKFFLVY